MSYAIVTYAHGNTHYIIITCKVLWSEINIASQLTVRMFISTHAIIPLHWSFLESLFDAPRPGLHCNSHK